MTNFQNRSKVSEYLQSETKRHSLIKFTGLILILVLYFTYVSVQMGPELGFFTTVLTWTFFVFCTPIADAGFLLAFPIRLLTGFRMMYTQLLAFVLAFFINLYTFYSLPALYTKTLILKLFYQILSHPYPFWGIIILSLIGTIFSIYFGDELVDVSVHSERRKYHKHFSFYKTVVFLFIIAITIVLYDFLLQNLGVNIPLV